MDSNDKLFEQMFSGRTPSPQDEAPFEDGSNTMPGMELSSASSPGSASDHMGGYYVKVEGGGGPQPILPGSCDLSAFESPTDSHQDRIITTSSSIEDPATTGRVGGRRTKRLERNRESARLSRRRRKQYLEQLEERVNKMAEDLDRSRRLHVSQAVSVLQQRRTATVLHESFGHDPKALIRLESDLSRTSAEMMLATTFQYQQLKSFSSPPHSKFIMWLTLQPDSYFRGGRAASERLSAARIGERIASSGTNRAPPSQSMWPLLCNEIGVSYDQEERVRNFQKGLLQDQKSWLDRHTAFSSNVVKQTAHDATQALTLRVSQREKRTMGILTSEQKKKFTGWSVRNREKLAASTSQVPVRRATREISTSQHTAANLYILNERLEKLLATIPKASPIITGKTLKRFSRRAAFESLGSCDDRQGGMSNDGAFPSSGSLKRCASEITMEGSDESKSHTSQQTTTSPTEAQAAAAPTLEQALHCVRDLLPKPPSTLFSLGLSSASAPAVFKPTPSPIPIPSLSYQAPVSHSAPHMGSLVNHDRKSSFIPEDLNVVPEEMWPAGEEATDEMLLDILEGDWGIGEGVDMELA